MAAEETVSLAFVHHANQYLITNGYDNREGLDDVVGRRGGENGYFKILELHQRYKVPMNLNVSGTLLEALLWYRPDFVAAVRELVQEGLIELVGSSYGQNIMRFFSSDHNRGQVNEQLELYRSHLGVDPQKVKAFWPSERVWDTERLAPVLTVPTLLNGGYKYVLIDDRLLYPVRDGALSRKAFDETHERRFEDFAAYRILEKQELIVLPLSCPLRQNIPPRDAGCLRSVEEVLRWLASAPRDEEQIAIYGDDLEKSAGAADWDPKGAAQYEDFLTWVRNHPWVHPVKLSEWAADKRVARVKQIDTGTFVELSNYFGAGEGYDNWYWSPRWDPHRTWYLRAEGRVETMSAMGGDPSLIELARKQLLATSWETAWHTPPWGVHGDPRSSGEPSPWIRALASHSRHAAVIAEAALWLSSADGEAHAHTADIDNDGEEELILRNHRLCAVFSPRWGGRLIYLFSLIGTEGKMVIGNPCDDWNWMEELNKYMEIPANHPGALTDIGCEHDGHDVRIEVADGSEAKAILINRQEGSRALGLEKALSLGQRSDEIRVTYRLPTTLSALTVECGFSPDYLHLLRFGRDSLESFRDATVWGYRNNGAAVWVRLDKASVTSFGGSREFGHGVAVRVEARSSPFAIWIGSAGPQSKSVRRVIKETRL